MQHILNEYYLKMIFSFSNTIPIQFRNKILFVLMFSDYVCNVKASASLNIWKASYVF